MKVAIMPNAERDIGLLVTERLIKKLRELDFEVIADSPLVCELDASIRLLDHNECFKAADMLFTVGGDGTILHVAQKAAMCELPIIGINMGKVGFMAELEPNELDLLDRLAEKNFIVETRMMLDVKVWRDDEMMFNDNALNDAVISRGTNFSLVDLNVFNRKEFISSYHADGIILATPTGSTAYSVSAGGPIVDPTLSCILSTPICAHTLTARSVLFNSDAELSVTFNSRKAPLCLTLDGYLNYQLTGNEIIRLKKSGKTTKLIKLKNISFYDTLSQKIK